MGRNQFVPVLSETASPSPRRTTRNGTISISNGTGETNYSQNDVDNKELGTQGEWIVVQYEKDLLIRNGREDLALEVYHVPTEKGDQEHYDVHSFKLNGALKLIEVKTTCSGINTPYYISASEVRFSEEHPDNYYLYRVYDFDRKTGRGKVYIEQGPVSNSFELEPIQFRATKK